MKSLSLSGFMLSVCGASVAQSTCTPGFYDPAGGSACVAALPGTFVPTAGATAATQAPPGSYVAVPAATIATLAPAGSYVSVAGATTANQAPPGSFVSGIGATAADPAPLGYYVAGFGATAPQAAGAGFYTAALASTAPIGAGLLATGANHAVSGTRQLLGARPALMNDSGLALNLLGGRSDTEQDGITGTERPSTRNAGLVLQGQLQSAAAGGGSVFAGWVDQKQESLGAGSADSTLWLAGWSQQVFGLRATAFGGQARASGVREVREIAAPEQQRWSNSTRMLGVQAAAAMRLPDWRAEWRLAGGLTQYQQKAFTEAGAVGSTAGLRIERWSHLAVPVQVTMWHDLGAAGFEWGARADLNRKKALQASLTNGQTFGFEIPVGQSATQALLARLTLNGWDVGSGLRLRGAIGVEAGPKTRDLVGQLGLEKRW